MPLSVKKTKGGTILMATLRFFDHAADKLVDESEILQKVVPHLSRKLIIGLEHVWGGGGRVPFRIPPSLRGSWTS